MEDMYTVNQRISRIWIIIIFLMMTGISTILPAADFRIDSAGNWDTPVSETLAGALQDADDGSTITLDGDITGPWTNWLTGGGYTIFSTPPLQISGGLLTFEMEGYTISGADLDIVTGNAIFNFNNGTLGATVWNLGIGVNGDATVTLEDIAVLAKNLQIGSETSKGVLDLKSGKISVDQSLSVIGSGSKLTLDGDSSIDTAKFFSILDGGTVESDGEITVDNLLKVAGYGSSLITTADATVATLSVEGGGAVTIDLGATFTISDDLTVSGVGVHEATVGDYYFLRSTLTVDGKLTVDGAILIEKGADADLSSLKTITATAVQSLTIRDVFFHDLSGESFQTTVTMDGDLIADGGTISVTGGAILNGVKNITATDGTVTIGGVFSDKLSGTRKQTTVAMDGVLTVDSTGKINVTNGAKLSGTKDISVNVGKLLVEGADGEKFRSEIAGSGVLTIIGDGTVDVKGGGLIGGRTGITVGDGTLNVSGMNAALMLSSTINSSGELIVGDGAVGTLKIDGGGLVTAGTTTIGQGADGSSVTVTGTGTGDRHSRLTIDGDLTLSESADASMTISQGGQVTVTGNSYIGNASGKTATLTLAGRGGTGATDARLNTAGQVIVGNGGDVNLTIDHGGNVTSGKETILGKEATSNVTVSINSDHYRAAWQAGGMPQDPKGGAYSAPLGNAYLYVKGGIVEVSGLFAMAGDYSSTGLSTTNPYYGHAVFESSGELNMKGGSFINMDTDEFIDTVSRGVVTIGSGGIVSGSGSIYAGEQFIVNGGTIAPGSRGMYDFNRSNNDKLQSLGTLDIYDRADKDTLFHNATFRTELDRGTAPDNTNGLSDRVIVHGDINVDSRFTIDFSRPLDGKYLLVQTVNDDILDNNTISGFVQQSLNGSAAQGDWRDLTLNLNGKNLKGNDRIDYFNGGTGGAFTTLENGDTEIWLTIKTTSEGNVVTYWTGDEAGTEWNMTARNFRARDILDTVDATFSGKDQFLDGDIVYFDYSQVTDPAKRIVNVTGNDVGDGFLGWTAVPNVRVAEVNVIGGTGSDVFVWKGESIFALDSALYSTLDQITNGKTPSGRFNKIDGGILEIWNANEFYGGIHLGDEIGTTGGLIKLYNEKGLGTYNSATGFQEKGLVHVHENSVIQLMYDDMEINNRFIVDPGKILTFMFEGSLTIKDNNALHSTDDSTRQGRGGGVFIGDDGQIVYVGTGQLILRNNKAKAGGGIYTQLGYTLQVPAYIYNNYADGPGGGIYAERYFALKDGSDISGNAAQSNGGGIYVGNTGRLLSLNDKYFVLHGNTQVVNNKSGGETGGGIYVDAGRVFQIQTGRDVASGVTFNGGDVWFEGNYAKVGFDPDNPTDPDEMDADNAIRNAIHLSNKATVGTAAGAELQIFGPYNTYFYDPISGDAGTKVTIEGVVPTLANTSHSLSPDQRGTVIFHDDSEFYGNTEVIKGATFRLEIDDDAEAIYGRRGSQEGTNNTFTLDEDSWITGQGTIAADSVILRGKLNLDTGTFSQPGRPDNVGDPAKDPPGRNGSGAVQTAGTMQGVLNLDGDVTIEDTSNWYLTLGPGGTTDRVDVTGKADFTGGTFGERIRFDIDDLIRGKYLVLTASDGFKDTYNTDKQKSDAAIYLGLNNLATNDHLTGLSDPVFGRVKATSYVDTNGTDLYLDLGGRNRHVTLTADSNWGYNDTWTFDTTGPIPTPTGTVGAGNWMKNDDGPATNVYLDGDMVTITGVAGGRTVTLTTPVRPVDLFVNGAIGADVLITGASGITTYSTTGTSAYGPRGTTIRPEGSTEVNDYDIDYYTGKLHKSEANKLTFATGANLFTEGIEFNVGGGNAGVISFSNVNQLTVGTGRTIDFLENGTLQLNLTGTSGTLRTSAGAGTNIRIANTKTATFDILANALTVAGVISNHTGSGAIEKIGVGTLVLSGTNTFTGGTTFKAGTIEIRNEKALGTYTASLGAAGSVYVRENVTKNLLVNNSYTINNRFDVSWGTAANVLSINIASGRTLTIDNSGITTGANGGAIYVDSGQGQLIFSNSPTYGGDLIIRNNTAERGGGIYSEVDSLLTFTGATSFISNTATVGSGGGLNNANAVAFNGAATIQSNTAQTNGGGIYADGAVTFNGATTIQSNTATVGRGGGVHATGNVTLNNNDDFTLGGAGSLGNTADLDGGGIYSGGSVALNGTGAKTISGNTAGTLGSGGGIYATGNVNITGTTGIGTTDADTGNTAGISGGGIYTGGTATFGTLNAYRNTATTGSGGAIYAANNVSITGAATLGSATAGTGNTAGTSGGAIYSGGDVAFGGAVSLIGNTAGTSGGAIWSGGTVDFQGTAAKSIGGNTAMGGSGGAVFAQNISLTGPATITGNTATDGGAFYIDGGKLTLLPTAAGDLIRFYNNTATNGSAVFLNGNAGIQIGGTNPTAGNVIFDDSIYGLSGSSTFKTMNNFTGTVMFAGGKSSTFNGDTTIDNGTFRITQGTTYGGTGTFVLLENNIVNPNSVKLTGGGTLEASAFDLYGTVAPDKNTESTAVPMSITGDERFGILTFRGGDGGDTVVTMYGNADPLSYQYEAHLAAGTTADDPNAWKTTGQSDLLSTIGTFYAEIGTDTTIHNPKKIVINVHNFGIGKYLLIEATDLLVTRNGIPEAIDDHDLDGIGDAAGAFTLLVHEAEKTNRHLVLFLRGNEQINSPDGLSNSVYANDAYNQYVDEHGMDPGGSVYDDLFAKAQNELWLATQTYNLLMYWTGKNTGDGATNLWQGTDSEASGNWREKMFSHSLEPETHFMHADSVVFAETYPDYPGIPGFTDSGLITVRGITIEPTGVRVTNMLVDNTAAGGAYSFSGGGITTTPNYAGDELDDLLGYMPGNAPQQLVKRGNGTLTFNNVLAAGNNTFSGGIVFETSPGSNAGIISFNRANQLGDGGNGITFNENGTLQANAAIASLTNNLKIADGKTATFNTNGNAVTHIGTINDLSGSDTGNFAKTGAGTLTLNAASNWSGTTTITTGTLVAVGVGTVNGTGSLGRNDAARTITVATGANLTLQIAGTETLKQQIIGAGSVTKTATGTLTLDNTNPYSGGTTISGGRIVAETLNAVGNNAATGNVTTAANTVLELKLETGEDGTFAQRITGSGKLVKSGDTPSTLTLSRNDNNYTGGTDIDSGRITITNVGAVGSNVAGGTVTMNGAGASLEFALTADGIFNQRITGSGQLIKTGSTTVTLTNTNNNSTGGIFFEASSGNAGTIAFSSGSNLGATNVITFNENGTLQANAAIPDTTPLTNELKIADGKTATFNTNGNDVTLSGKIDEIGASDTGAFTKIGAGTLTLTNVNNDWNGTTTISAGTLQANGVGTLGWNDFAHEIVNNATLDINITSGQQTLSQLISGAGTVRKIGAGELIFDQVNNTYSGGTTITTGMLTVKHVEHEILSVSQNGGLGTGNVVINATGANTGLNFDIEEDGTFSRIISGAGMVTKSGDETLTLSGTSTYTGATNIDGGKVLLTNIAGTGTNATGTTTTVHLAAGTELEINVAGTNTYNKTITGAGQLSTNGTLTLAGTNIFTGGTVQKGGTLTLGNIAAIGAYTTPGETAGSLQLTDSGTTTLGVAGTYQNRFVIDPSQTWRFDGSVDATISGVQSGQDGGVIYLGAGSTANIANTGAWTFTGNTGTGGVPNDIYLDGATLNFTSTGNTFFNSGIAGTGTISKTGAGIVQIAENSAFDGATTISAGTFRIVDNKTFGDAATDFTLSSGATLAGQGTIKAAQINLYGIATPDSVTFVAGGSTIIPPADRFGILTLDGQVNLADTFTFNYNVGEHRPSAAITSDWSVDNYITTGDLIRMIGGGVGGYQINNQLINFVETLTTGKYLIFIADQDFTLPMGATLDGIKAGGVAKATIPDEQSPRGSFEFIWGTSATGNNIHSQIWLDVDRNTLEMTWQEGPYSSHPDHAYDNVWVSGGGKANFLSTQFHAGTQELVFNDGDYVIFGDLPTDQTIIIGNVHDTDGVIVSGMKVTANTNYTFNGDGITALTEHKTIEGDYIPGGAYHSGATPVNPDGKLQKSGTGTLTFANGANLFTEGIDIAGGTIGFSNGNQLQVGSGKAITFTGIAANNARLQANAAITTLATNVIVTTGNKGTIDTLTNKLTNTGSIDIAGGGAIELATGSSGFLFQNGAVTGTGTVTKTGAGTVQIGTDSTFNGATTVSDGTFRVVDDKTFGGAATSFTAGVGTTVAGGGTIKADGITIRGIISPDSDTFSAEKLSVDAARKFGVLTLDGNVTLDGFTMTYDVDMSKVQNTKVTTADIDTGDLLRIIDAGSSVLVGGTIDIQATSLDTGYYLIAESTTAFNTGVNPLDGINETGGVLHLTLNGTTLVALSPRTLYQFSYGDTSTTTNARIWLHADTNSLTMDWQNGDGTWNTTATAQWESLQTNAGNHEYIFRNGDYVRFLQTTNASIDIAAGTRIVSGMVVDNAVNTTFTGTGGIRSTEDDPSIIGKYLPAGVGTPTLTPDGKLQKSGAGMLTFENTGGNLFEEGVDIAAGTVGFNDGNQLKVGSGKAITFTGGAANNARLQANDTTTLATNVIVTNGNKGAVDTLANSLTHTGGIATVGNGEIELATATGGFLFQNGAVTGTGTVTKTGAGTVQIGANSAFSGATTVSGGTFRVAQGISYGTTGSGSASFTAGVGTTVAGGGTIRATEITLAGIVTPDSEVFTTGSTAVLPANRFGTLTLDGKVNLASTFNFNYHAGTPVASTTVTPVGYNTPTGDLIKMQNGGASGYTINDGATVNFVDVLISGKYLIFMADRDFMLVGGNGELDGIKAGGVSKATFDAPENQTPRGSFEFIWGTSIPGTNDIKSQIWLDVDRNTLEMTWHDTPESNIWVSAAGDANFLSTQKGIDGITQEQMFNDGDYVIFDTKTDDQEITIGNATDTDGVIVSGMKVNANSNYTFTGNGITALTAHETIEGDYIGPNPLFLPKVNPDGKLQKSGTGVLTFSNGVNRFTKGIEISGGTIAFSNANQLNTLDVDPGHTDRGITFLGSGTLRSNANIPSLANNIKLSNLVTATFDTNGYNMTLNGKIDDIAGTGNVTKEGLGTLTLMNTTNDWNGTTDVKSGTLLAIGIETLGNNVSSRTITVESGANLTLQIAAAETLHQELYGGGEVRKTGEGDLRFDPNTDGLGFTGRFNFAKGNTYLDGADFRNTDSFVVGTGATLYGTGWLGSLGSEGGVIQTGAKLIPSGVFIDDDPSIPPTATFLNISGNLTFEKQSLYQVVLTQYPDSTFDPNNPNRMRPVSDMIVVHGGGKVEIKDGAELEVLIDYWNDQLVPSDFGATTSGRFTIIDATDGSVADPTAQFVLLDAGLPRGVDFTHGWVGLLYQLWLDGDSDGVYRATGRTQNQKEIGKLLDYLMTTKDPGMQELLRILSQREISDDMLRDILGQLAGDLRANSIGMALKMPWRHPFNRIDRDMFPRPFDPCQPITCRPEYKYTREFWAEGYGSFSNTRFDGNAYANTVRRLGMAVGFDQRICEYSLFGTVFNYSKPVLHQETGRAEADDYEIGIYNLTKITGTVDLKSYFGYSHQEYDLRRHVFIPAGARYDAVYDSYRNTTRGDSFAMSFELLRPMDYNDYVTIAPLMALDYEYVWQKGYSESGGLTALRYGSSSLERLMSRFGINTKVFVSNRFDLHARIQYATQLNYKEYPRSGTHFVNAMVGGAPIANIRGSSIGRDHLNIGIGGEYYLNRKRSMSVHLGYDTDLWKRMSIHTGNLGYTHRW